MIIGLEDLKRLYEELIGNPDSTYNDKGKWLEEESLDPISFMKFSEAMANTFAEMVVLIPNGLSDEEESSQVQLAAMAACASAFGIGWEAHKQFGAPRTEIEE